MRIQEVLRLRGTGSWMRNSPRSYGRNPAGLVGISGEVIGTVGVRCGWGVEAVREGTAASTSAVRVDLQGLPPSGVLEQHLPRAEGPHHPQLYCQQGHQRMAHQVLHCRLAADR